MERLLLVQLQGDRQWVTLTFHRSVFACGQTLFWHPGIVQDVQGENEPSCNRAWGHAYTCPLGGKKDVKI
jgi:hypothetical protein